MVYRIILLLCRKFILQKNLDTELINLPRTTKNNTVKTVKKVTLENPSLFYVG